MLKNKNKKKKGFTLIELVIVLAVLAIIALIAIPNFTRVRNNALVQADRTSEEQITNIIQTAIAEGAINPVIGTEYTIDITVTGRGTTKTVTANLSDDTIYGTVGTETFSDTVLAAQHLRDIDAPQVAGTTGYEVTIAAADGSVTTTTVGATTP